MKRSDVSDADKKKAKNAILDLIEECKSGPTATNETASERLRAVAEAADVLLRF